MPRTHVRIQALAEGLDAAICLMQDLVSKKRETLVFDLMEPLRSVVDREVLDLVLSETFSAKDFVVTRDGVCRLNPQLARRVSTTISCSPSLSRGSRDQALTGKFHN